MTFSSHRYLVQGSQGSILHTGDFRAEPSFLKSLADDSILKPFLAQGGNRTLDAIYLDTACVWSSSEPPSKVRSYFSCPTRCMHHTFSFLQKVATDGLVDLMSRFPHTTYFFINAWTWGYEDMLTAVAARFGDKVSLPFDVTPSLNRTPDSRGPIQTLRIFSYFTRRVITGYHTGYVLDQVPRVRKVRSV